MVVKGKTVTQTDIIKEGLTEFKTLLAFHSEGDTAKSIEAVINIKETIIVFLVAKSIKKEEETWTFMGLDSAVEKYNKL